MSKHEQKQCPRCGNDFECRVGDVVHCQCYGITLDASTQGWIAQAYGDCLCRQCLLQLKDTTLSQTDVAFQAVHKKNST